jgi:glycosyltransferase involved in cell wall biosynthesis
MRGLYGLSATIHVIPNGIDVQSYDDTRAAMQSRVSDEPLSGRSILFTATFAHPPNEKAALFLIREVFPRLTAVVPDCRLLLVGNMAIVVPIFQGSGTRFKILEAFASRTPVISTAIGAEGLQVKPEIHLLTAENASEFVSGLQRLWLDASLAGRLTENAYRLVKRNFSWNVAQRKIAEAVHELSTF